MVVCTQGGQGAKALELFDSMPGLGIVPSVATLLAAVSACEVAGRPEKALEVLRKLKDRGCKPPGKIFSAAIRACAAASMWDDVITLVDEVKLNGLEADDPDLLRKALRHRAKRRTELRLLLENPKELQNKQPLI
jgi:pentatricopeptide repeat protein